MSIEMVQNFSSISRRDNLRGAFYMAASLTFFALNDACLKLLSDDVPFGQLLVLRGALTTILLVLVGWALGAFKHLPKKYDLILIVVRAGTEIGTAFFFLSALFSMPIANVTAIMQFLPLSVTLAGALFMAEPIGWRRMAAICIGMVGVLLIVQPGTDGFNMFSLYGLIAVGFATMRDLITRKLSPEVNSLFVAFVATVMVVLLGVIISVNETWVALDRNEGMTLAVASVFIFGAYLFSVMSMRVGEIDFVAPFRYSGLLAAVILGIVLFQEWPDLWMLLGSLILVATGTYTIWREGKIRR